MVAPAGSLNPVVPNTAKIACEQTIGSVSLVNTFYCETSTPLAAGDGNALASGVPGAWGSLLADLSTAWTYVQTVVTDLSVAGGAQYTATSGTVGTETANPLPYQTAAGVSWRTNRVGRSYRGRSYLGGFTEADSNGQGIASGLVTAIDGWATSLENIINAIGTFVVVSRVTMNTSPPPASMYRATNVVTPITSHVVPVIWETQRRRAS